MSGPSTKAEFLPVWRILTSSNIVVCKRSSAAATDVLPFQKQVDSVPRQHYTRSYLMIDNDHREETYGEWALRVCRCLRGTGGTDRYPGFSAQELVGSRLFGTVTDPSGKVVPGATLILTAPATGFSRALETDGDGSYLAPQILADTYEIQVSSPGFKTTRVTDIQVRVNESPRVDVRLELGDVSTKVDVQSQAALINTYSSELSLTIDSRRMVRLPLNARDVTALAMLGPGTTDPVQTSFYANSSGFAGTAPSVNGSRIQDNNYLLDGVSNLYSQRLSSNLYPNPDAIEEFTVNLAQYSAEFGGRPGGQLSARTKSGTNRLHGSLFEFLRNPKLNARNWADTRGLNDGIKRNQWGWAVGGPVVIPKVFDGRNKLFWFNSFQQIPFRTRGRPGFFLAFTGDGTKATSPNALRVEHAKWRLPPAMARN